MQIYTYKRKSISSCKYVLILAGYVCAHSLRRKHYCNHTGNRKHRKLFYTDSDSVINRSSLCYSSRWLLRRRCNMPRSCRRGTARRRLELENSAANYFCLHHWKFVFLCFYDDASGCLTVSSIKSIDWQVGWLVIDWLIACFFAE